MLGCLRFGNVEDWSGMVEIMLSDYVCNGKK